MPEVLLLNAVHALYAGDAYVLLYLLVDGDKCTPALHGCLLCALFASDLPSILNTINDDASAREKGGFQIQTGASERALITHLLYADDRSRAG